MCISLVQSGPRKGKKCLIEKGLDEAGYCPHHQRAKQYDMLTSQGKHLCRFFLRGCDNSIDASEKTCASCIASKRTKTKNCKHTGCESMCHDSNTLQYCGKHLRDYYAEYETENDVHICNIERGCFNICHEEYQSCFKCIIADYAMNDRWFDYSYDNDYTCIVCQSKYEHSPMCNTLKRCPTCVETFLQNNKSTKINQLRSISEMKKNNIITHYDEYIKGANFRSREFKISLNDFIYITSLPCFYCSSSPSDHLITGIDRVDNTKDYVLDNIVPCCSICNRMKATSTADEFIQKCRLIHTFQHTEISQTIDFINTFPSYLSPHITYFKEYVGCNIRRKRQITFELNEYEYYYIKEQECYLCGLNNLDNHKNGIDRMDDSRGYIYSNCRACCNHCNMMKFQIPLGVFLNKVKLISNATHAFKPIVIPAQKEPATSETQVARTRIITTEKQKSKVRMVVEEIAVDSIAIPETPTPPTSDFPVPKQWKAKGIYDAIVGNAGHLYKFHCEQSNDIPDPAEWECRWNTLITTVQSATFKDSEAAIRELVEWLRTLRHNKLVATKQKKRTDRQVWTAVHVKYLYDEGRIAEFKAHTEAFAGDSDTDPNWVRRWKKFLETLGEFGGESENAVKYISSFMATQRTYKCNRSKAQT